MTIKNLEQASIALRAYMPSHQKTDWNFALEQMSEMMAKLGNPQDGVKAIHVAGTSGKTSTCYYIAAMLQQAGKQVGLSVSPHVDGLNERVQINGKPLPEADFCRLLGKFLDLPAVTSSNPSYFGVMVGFAYWVFAQKQLDYIVVEVGLGGRKDATNIITRPDKVAVITDIGLDHTEMLGDTLELIAAEKAEIVKPGNQVFVAQQIESVLQVFQKKSDITQAIKVVEKSTEAPKDLPLFQQRNWSLAKQAVEYVAQRDGFEFTLAQARAAGSVRIPARMEVVKFRNKTVIMDGAHNAQKVTALCESIKQRYPDKLPAVVSFAQGKDTSLDEAMSALATIVNRLIITSFMVEQDVPKIAIDPAVVQRAALKAGIQEATIINDPSEAFARLMALPEKQVLVTGSFYLLNTVRPLVGGLND